MGITVNDDIEIAHIGFNKTKFYLGFADSPIIVHKVKNNEYEIRATAGMWINKGARQTEKQVISNVNVGMTVNKQGLDANIYDLLYAKLKTNYVDTIDELDE